MKHVRYMDYFEKKCSALRHQLKLQRTYSWRHPALGQQLSVQLNCVKAEGPYLYDVDGNRYIDFLQAGGPTILGNAYRPVTDAVIEMLNTTGNVTGLFGEFEVDLAKKIKQHYPSVELFRMLASGTEAGMVAIRVARAFTGKSEIIKINGCYHGWSDQLLYDMRAVNTGNMFAVGVPDDCLNHMCSVYPNDLEELDSALLRMKPRAERRRLLWSRSGRTAALCRLRRNFM